MRLSKELAEVLGIFAADRSMQDNHVCMWGNINEDKEYYDKIVCPLFSKVFNKQIKAHEKKSNSVYGFYLCDKKAVNFLKNLGFSKKKTYNVKAPQIAIDSKNPEIIGAFIRGFSDCDGCFSLMKRKGKYTEFKTKFHTYPRIILVSVSKSMVEDLSNLLKTLYIPHTVCIENREKSGACEVYRIMIRGDERVEEWMNKIGFNNPAQYSRYLVWKKFGFCPSNTNLKKRRLILSDELDPLPSIKRSRQDSNLLPRSKSNNPHFVGL